MNKDIERIQKRAMKIICPELDYHQALVDQTLSPISMSARRGLTVKRVQMVDIMQKNILSGSRSEKQRKQYTYFRDEV